MPRKYRRYRRPRLGRVNKIKKMVDGKDGIPSYMKQYNGRGGGIPSLMRTVKGIQSRFESEIKYIDTGGAPSITTTGTFVYYSGVPQGTDNDERIGMSILMKSLTVNMEIAKNVSAGSTWLRILFFVDKDCNASAPAVTDVLELSTTRSPPDRDHRQRFVILKDLHLNLHQYKPLINIKVFLKLPFKHRYLSSTGLIGGAASNAIFCLMLSNETTNAPVVDFVGRLSYYDA